MNGANPSSPSKCCLARAAGVGQILNRLGTILDCLPRAAKAIHGLICCGCSNHPMPPSNKQHCCHVACTTQHHNVSHVIVIHNCDYRSSSSYPCGYVFHLEQSSCLYVDDGIARRWFLILFGVISDVTVNKDVGYQMYDDVDDSYILWIIDYRSDIGYYLDL